MAFLTAIPLKMDEDFLELSASFMFLFPVIGAVIGFFAGLYSFFTNYFLSLLFGFLNTTFFSGPQNTLFVYLAKGLASVMTLSFLLVLTGLQHTDGLIDVGNALGIRKASVEERVEIAHAWIVTRTGALLALLVSLCTLVLIFLIKPEAIIRSLIVAEVSAKLAMATCAWQGTSLQKGLGSIFIDSMKKRHSLYIISLAASLLVST
ncbi:adenosylcobinamide-GDP ribazoletransferase, partial [Candidatus Bathyarchaeota archaeon]|nr:adenosylcobinamide-GDP ribazoletransferase [Candidatus Bathyarchaeota archaeon]